MCWANNFITCNILIAFPTSPSTNGPGIIVPIVATTCVRSANISTAGIRITCIGSCALIDITTLSPRAGISIIACTFKTSSRIGTGCIRITIINTHCTFVDVWACFSISTVSCVTCTTVTSVGIVTIGINITRVGSGTFVNIWALTPSVIDNYKIYLEVIYEIYCLVNFCGGENITKIRIKSCVKLNQKLGHDTLSEIILIVTIF